MVQQAQAITAGSPALITSSGWTGGLVTAVRAVEVTVAKPGGRDTFPVTEELRRVPRQGGTRLRLVEAQLSSLVFSSLAILLSVTLPASRDTLTVRTPGNTPNIDTIQPALTRYLMSPTVQVYIVNRLTFEANKRSKRLGNF